MYALFRLSTKITGLQPTAVTVLLTKTEIVRFSTGLETAVISQAEVTTVYVIACPIVQTL